MKQPEIAKLFQGKLLKKGLPWFSWVIILLIITGLTTIFSACSPSSSNSHTGQLKAAIIDQLYSTQPNDDFITQASRDLENYGFTVHVYQGERVTVNLYRKLPKYGYKLIIFRAHSGLIQSRGQKLLKTAIFTNEPYSQTKYLREQLNHELPMVRVRESEPFFFGIDSKFVMESMEGRFDDTVIVVAGCSCFYFNDMAQAFIRKGASIYLAWDRSVDADYVDEANAYLIRQLCMEGTTLKEAVNRTMLEKGKDPTYNATLKHFPPVNCDKTLERLIQQDYMAVS